MMSRVLACLASVASAGYLPAPGANLLFNNCKMDAYDGNPLKWLSKHQYFYHQVQECEDLCDAQATCAGFVQNYMKLPFCDFKTKTSPLVGSTTQAFWIKFSGPAPPPPPPPPSPPPAPEPPSPAPGSPPGSIVSNSNGKCLDLPGGDTTDGNALWTWECDGGPSQQWAWNDYQIQWDGGLVWTHCVDVPGDDLTNGNYVQIWECVGTPQQQWGYDDSSGTIYLASSSDASKCLDLVNGGADDGTPVQVWDCDNTNFNQMWGLGAGDTRVV